MDDPLNLERLLTRLDDLGTFGWEDGETAPYDAINDAAKALRALERERDFVLLIFDTMARMLDVPAESERAFAALDLLKSRASRATAAEARADEVTAENTRLRAALANSDQPCVYCTLPADEWAKCQHGFPGCARADDSMGCPELGAAMALHDTKTRADALAAALEFYAAPGNYQWDIAPDPAGTAIPGTSPIDGDQGERARDALSAHASDRKEVDHD